MPNYKDSIGYIHFLDDAEYQHFLPEGCVPITDAEADALRAPTADQVKSFKWSAISAERDRRTENGGYKVDTKWFHSDQKSRSQQLGLVLLGANIPTNLRWKTMDGSFVAMTQTLAQQILFAAATSDQDVFATAEAKRVVIDASDDPAAYDVTVGWPKIFGE